MLNYKKNRNLHVQCCTFYVQTAREHGIAQGFVSCESPQGTFVAMPDLVQKGLPAILCSQ
jgi:hypothetical protein